VHHNKDLKAVQEAEIEEFKRKYEAVSNKIMFNTVLEFSKLTRNWKKKKVLMDKQEKLRISQINKKDAIKDIPVALKYLKDTPEIQRTNGDEIETLPGNEIMCLPYSIETELNAPDSSRGQDYESKCVDRPYQRMLISSELSSSSSTQLPARMSDTSVSSWMSDYECYDESEDMLENPKPWELNYGIPDVNVPLSDVPCGGCGALLHCQVNFCTQSSVGHSVYADPILVCCQCEDLGCSMNIFRVLTVCVFKVKDYPMSLSDTYRKMLYKSLTQIIQPIEWKRRSPCVNTFSEWLNLPGSQKAYRLTNHEETSSILQQMA
jgi:hypothetical protein